MKAVSATERPPGGGRTLARVIVVLIALGLPACNLLEPQLPELPGQQRPVGPEDILGTRGAGDYGEFLGGGSAGRHTSLPNLPANPGDGRIEGMARPSGTSSGGSWVPAEMKVIPEGTGARLEFAPSMGFDPPIRRDELDRLRSRLERVDFWVQQAPENDVLERWMLEKRWMVPGTGGSVAARRRVEVWFHAKERGAWTGVRIELREEERPEFGWEGDFMMSPAEAADWLHALP